MNNRELDIKAAKALGVRTEHYSPVWLEWSTKDGMDGGNGFACPKCNISAENYDDTPCCEYYTVDANACRELLAEVERRGVVNTFGKLLGERIHLQYEYMSPAWICNILLTPLSIIVELAIDALAAAPGDIREAGE
jgi:hypothetical protein